MPEPKAIDSSITPLVVVAVATLWTVCAVIIAQPLGIHGADLVAVAGIAFLIGLFAGFYIAVIIEP